MFRMLIKLAVVCVAMGYGAMAQAQQCHGGQGSRPQGGSSMQGMRPQGGSSMQGMRSPGTSQMMSPGNSMLSNAQPTMPNLGTTDVQLAKLQAQAFYLQQIYQAQGMAGVNRALNRNQNQLQAQGR